MASKGALARRRAQAVQRIEQAVTALTGGQPLTLPQTNRFGPDHLLVAQLEAVVAYLESAALDTTPQYDSMKLAELRTLAEERGLNASHLRSKAAVIALLKQADVTMTETESHG